MENTVDNTNGTIRFLAGSTNAASANFDLADFRLQVKADAPVEGPPTPIVFLVNGSAETSAARSGQELLANPTDFTGASISVTNRVVQIVMVPDSLQVPIARSPGSTVDFTVRVILNGVEATAVQLDMTFDPQLLQVVDGAGNPATQVTPNAASPFNPNNVGSFTIKNSVDNTNGTISFLAGNASPASTSFDLVDIRIKAGDVLTPAGDPTEVVFRVSGSDQTSVSTSGLELLENTADFVGARIEVVRGAPTVSLSGDDSANEGDTRSYSFTITGLDGGFTIPGGFPDCGTGGTLVANSLSINDSGGIFDCFFGDGPATPTVTFQVTDSFGTDSNVSSIPVTVSNVAPTVVLTGNSNASEGQSKTYTFTVTDPGEDDFVIFAGFPSCGIGAILVSGTLNINAGGGNFRCSFPNGPASPTVAIRVTDSDGDDSDVAILAVTVTGEGPVTSGNDWTGTLTITGTDNNDASLSDGDDLIFGIRPFCTDLFEFSQQVGGQNFPCDEPLSVFLGADALEAFSLNPGGGDPVTAGVFDNTKLPISRFAPPDPANKVLKWPFSIEIERAGATSADVTIQWNISTVPGEFITVLLIDHDTLPAYNVTNMGPSATGSYTIPGGIPLDGDGMATRDLTLVVSRSHVQAMALPADFNIVALTVQPESTSVQDIFTFSGPDRHSLVDDPLSAVFFVQTWNPRSEVPIAQWAGQKQTLRGADELDVARGYLVFVINFNPAVPPRDHMLIIAGQPIFDTTRGP